MSSHSQTAVKPCPFCGGAKVSTHEGSTFRWVYAACDECGAQAGEVRKQTLGEGNPEEWHQEVVRSALAEWNQRAPQQDGPAGVVEKECDRSCKGPASDSCEWPKCREPQPEAGADCDHQWVSARNEVVASGEICLRCYAVRAEPSATDRSST